MPSIFVSPYVLPIMLLFASNLFMTIAWYGHLRFKEVPLFGVIVVSWLIAFVEYCAAVPANRWGSAVYTTAQLKTIQEVITLLIFAGFSIVYLKEPLTWNYAIGFVLIASGAFFVFRARYDAMRGGLRVHVWCECVNGGDGTLPIFHVLVMIGKGGDRQICATVAENC